jgi:hypothetical protein
MNKKVKFKILIIFMSFAIFFTNNIAHAEQGTRLQLFKLKISNELPDPAPDGKLLKTWKYVKGNPSDSAILGGMWSMHTSTHKDEMCGENNLVGIDYNGYTVGTFKNSYRNQSVFAGLSRTVYTVKLTKGVNMEFKYKIGAIYGYKDKYPNALGISPLAYPLIGINYKKVGTDITIIPSDRPIFASNFRFNL